MTEAIVLNNSRYDNWIKLMRTFGILLLAVAIAVSLLYSAFVGMRGLLLLLIFAVAIPTIIFPPYSPRTVTLSEDKLHLEYRWPLKDISVRWTCISVISVWRRRPLLEPDFCTLTFFDGNGNKVRPPFLLHVSTEVADEVEKFLGTGNRGVTVKRENAPWWI